jgi:hypothetical protein
MSETLTVNYLFNDTKHLRRKSTNILMEKSADLWRVCNLTVFTPCLTGPVDYPFASHHEDLGSIPRGYLCETKILLLALSHYIGDPYVIDHCGLV